MIESKQNIPNTKLLPHMIDDHEVPAIILNETNAKLSKDRRAIAAQEREQKNQTTKMIASAAAVGAAVVGFIVQHHEINKAQAKVTDPSSQVEP